MFADVAFVGAIAVGAFGLLIPGGEIAAAISADDISASTAAALSSIGDGPFVAAEMSAVLLMLGTAGVALRTALFPTWWGWACVVLALALVVGPIGWAALIFGLPIWTLVTTWFLSRGARTGAPALAEA
jgi:hypothetical protein